MVVLGIDLGSKLGFAVGEGGRIIECGTIELSKRAAQFRCSNETALWKFLRDKIKARCVQTVAWENSVAAMSGSAMGVRKGAQFGMGRSLVVHAGLESIVRVAAETSGVRVLDPVPNNTLKKFATGSGRAEKPDMVRSANMTYGLDLKDSESDAADACHVCAWAMQQAKAG